MKRLAMRTRLVCSTLVAVAVTGTLAGQARPLRVEDVLAVQQFADREQLAVSPDSRLVAYALVDPGRASALAEADHSNRFSPSGVPVSDRGADVFLTDYRSGTTRNLTGAQGSSWGPVWSPTVDGWHSTRTVTGQRACGCGIGSTIPCVAVPRPS